MNAASFTTSHQIKILLKPTNTERQSLLNSGRETKELLLHGMKSMTKAAQAALQQWQLSSDDIETIWIHEYRNENVVLLTQAPLNQSSTTHTDTLCINGEGLKQLLDNKEISS